ncbi:hypothetical protein UR09_00400 [Candidatus Nitromaritima sp. SCGC AAA799-A02]|nr:hypothetical protein UR09_00400 [Candidatus Nitromaritima sp. SCGC AAA799-A02]
MKPDQQTNTRQTPETNPAFGTTGDAISILILFLVAALFFFPVLFSGHTFFFRDITQYHYPMKYFVSQAYHDGFLPFWNPSIFGGYPFLAELQPAVFYPPNLIFFLDDFPTAFNLYYIFHYLVLSLSVYVLTRAWEVCEGAALCSALTAMLGGYFLSMVFYSTHFQSASWFPLILFLFSKYFKEGGLPYLIGAVIFVSFQFLGGSPESCMMSFALLFFICILLLPHGTRAGVFFRRTLLLAGAALFALALTALQLLPTYSLISESVRQGGLAFGDHAVYSLAPESLAHIIFPDNSSLLMERNSQEPLNFILSYYMGFLAVISLFTGLLFLNRKEIRFWIGVFLISLFFALGEYNLFYKYFYDWLPFLKMFRFPEKFYFFSAFSLIFLSAHVLDLYMKPAHNGGLPFRPILYLLTLLGAVAISIGIFIPGSSFLYTLGLLVLFGTCWSLFHFGKLNPRGFQSLTILILLADLTLAHYYLIPVVSKSFYEKEPELAKWIKQDNENFRIFSAPIRKLNLKNSNFTEPDHLWVQLAKRERLYPNLAMLYGIEDVSGLFAIEMKDAQIWSRIFNNSSPERKTLILKRSNVKYWIANPVYFDALHEQPFNIGKSVKVLEDALPRAFLVNHVRYGTEPFLLNTYFSETFDPRQEVLLSERVTMEKETSDFTGIVNEIRYAPNRVTVRTRQNGAGFLVLLDSYFPGWKVTVDGQEGRILRANHFYRAVALDSGEHTLEFSYEAVGFEPGLMVSSVALLVLIIAGIFPKKIQKGLPNTYSDDRLT